MVVEVFAHAFVGDRVAVDDRRRQPGKIPAGVVDAFQLEALDLGRRRSSRTGSRSGCRSGLRMRSGRNWQPLVRSKAESVVAADIVADVVVEIGGLEPQAVIAGGDAVQRVVDAEFPGLAGLRLEVRIGQEREGDAVRMQAADQRLGDRRRAIAFGIGAVDLQPFERALAERRDADGDARRQPVAGTRRPSRRRARSCRSAVRRSPAAIPRSACSWT